MESISIHLKHFSTVDNLEFAQSGAWFSSFEVYL